MTRDSPTSRRAHWENVYQRKHAETLSWYRPHLDLSLELLADAGLSAQSRIIDVGGGASTLVDDLLDRGVHAITVLDLSAESLALAQRRLGDRAHAVTWIVGDITRIALPERAFDYWHDRAVLQFLIQNEQTRAYAAQVARSLVTGGHAVIGGFAPEGPARCSGLPVARRSPQDIAELLGPDFRLLAERSECHHTPAGSEQPFSYALLERRESGGPGRHQHGS